MGKINVWLSDKREWVTMNESSFTGAAFGSDFCEAYLNVKHNKIKLVFSDKSSVCYQQIGDEWFAFNPALFQGEDLGFVYPLDPGESMTITLFSKKGYEATINFLRTNDIKFKTEKESSNE